MKKVAIVGVGLIGGSLGLATRRRYRILGLGRDRASLSQAKRVGAVHEFSTNPKDIIPKADIVVICVPVHKIAAVVRQILPYIKRGAVLTDVGSVKKSVVDAVSKIISRRKDIHFVGGHPIAGSEKAGVQNASADLFRGATTVLVKDRASFHALDEVRLMWKLAGAKCVLMDARTHDRVLAMTSHLPHLLSFALFDLVRSAWKKDPVVRALVGGSFRDMTRIAHSDSSVWSGILQGNRAEIKKSASAFLMRLRSLSASKPAAFEKFLRNLK